MADDAIGIIVIACPSSLKNAHVTEQREADALHKYALADGVDPLPFIRGGAVCLGDPVVPLALGSPRGR